jgi:hypothetical protein
LAGKRNIGITLQKSPYCDVAFVQTTPFVNNHRDNCKQAKKKREEKIRKDEKG